MNNEERRMWILNDEEFYQWWKKSKKSLRQFIKENRKEIDDSIKRVLDPTCKL